MPVYARQTSGGRWGIPEDQGRGRREWMMLGGHMYGSCGGHKWMGMGKEKLSTKGKHNRKVNR